MIFTHTHTNIYIYIYFPFKFKLAFGVFEKISDTELNSSLGFGQTDGALSVDTPERGSPAAGSCQLPFLRL